MSTHLEMYAEAGVTLDRLLAFLAVADAGAFVRAAPGDVSRQSLLNRQVRQLEQALRATLFERRGRGVVVTPAGAQLRAALEDLTLGLRGVSALGRPAAVELTLAAGDGALQWLVLPTLGALKGPRGEALGETRFTLLASSDAAADVSSGVAHFGLARERALAPDLTHRRVGVLRFVACVPRGLASAGEAPTTLGEAMRRCPWVEVTGDRAALEAAARAEGVDVRPALRCETFPQAAQAVSTGAYGAVLPAFATTALAGAPVDVLPLDASDVEAPTLALVGRLRALEAQPTVRAVFDALARALQSALSPPEMRK